MRDILKSKLDPIVARIGDQDFSECILWAGSVNEDGYGVLTLKLGDAVRSITAQRIIYTLFWGEIPDGLVVDHECRNRLCINPYHLRAITNRQNILIGMCVAAQNLRKTHCVAGHPLSGDNVLIVRGGDRSCRMCAQRRKRAWENKNRGKSWEV